MDTVDRSCAEQILSSLIPDDQLATYASLLLPIRDRNMRCAVGGGLAASAYSGFCRNTKDLDFYVLAGEHKELLDLMEEQGFSEYTKFPYDPTWSYRGTRNGFIVDVLWKMLNERTEIDDTWVSGGWELEVRGIPFRLVPPEELIWSKLYIMRRDRCDWTDLINIIHGQGEMIDWDRLLDRLEDDAPLLGSIMNLYRWLCPGRTAAFPPHIWKPMGLLARQEGGGQVDHKRVTLFQAQNWFAGGKP